MFSLFRRPQVQVQTSEAPFDGSSLKSPSKEEGSYSGTETDCTSLNSLRDKSAVSTPAASTFSIDGNSLNSLNLNRVEEHEFNPPCYSSASSFNETPYDGLVKNVNDMHISGQVTPPSMEVVQIAQTNRQKPSNDRELSLTRNNSSSVAATPALSMTMSGGGSLSARVTPSAGNSLRIAPIKENVQTSYSARDVVVVAPTSSTATAAATATAPVVRNSGWRRVGSGTGADAGVITPYSSSSSSRKLSAIILPSLISLPGKSASVVVNKGSAITDNADTPTDSDTTAADTVVRPTSFKTARLRARSISDESVTTTACLRSIVTDNGCGSPMPSDSAVASHSTSSRDKDDDNDDDLHDFDNSTDGENGRSNNRYLFKSRRDGAASVCMNENQEQLGLGPFSPVCHGFSGMRQYKRAKFEKSMLHPEQLESSVGVTLQTPADLSSSSAKNLSAFGALDDAENSDEDTEISSLFDKQHHQ